MPIRRTIKRYVRQAEDTAKDVAGKAGRVVGNLTGREEVRKIRGMLRSSTRN